MDKHEEMKFIANAIWEGFQKRNAKFFDDIADYIYRTGEVPLLRLTWEEKSGDIKAEYIKRGTNEQTTNKPNIDNNQS